MKKGKILTVLLKIYKSKKIKNFSSIKESDNDAYVVGSDQVWRPQNFLMHWNERSMQDSFLSFTKKWNVKRYSYAASFGTNTWEFSPTDTIECALLAKNFNYVSVREKDSIDLCRNNLHIDCDWVLDPTMLLTSDDYCKLIDNNSTPPIKVICSCTYWINLKLQTLLYQNSLHFSV